MRKKFFINILLLLGLNLLVKPFWILGIDRSIQNTTGSEAYGMYFALFNFSLLFNAILDAGLTNLNNYEVAQKRATAGKNLSKLGSIKLLLALLYLTFTWACAELLNYPPQEIQLLLFLSVNQVLLSMLLFVRSGISGKQIFWLDSLLSVLDRVLLIGICSVLLWSNWIETAFQIEWLVYSQGVTYCLALFTAVLALLKMEGGWVFQFPKQEIRETLKRSVPYAAIILFMSLYFRVDAVMIEYLLPSGKTEAGYYAQGYRFLDVINNFVYLFIGILFPMLSRMFAESQKVDQVVALGLNILLLPLVGIYGIALLQSEWIIGLAYDEFAVQSAGAFSILLMSYLPLVVSQIAGTVITASGHLNFLIKWSGGAFLINVISNFLLIPEMGIQGAALASFASQSFMAVVCLVYCTTQLKILPLNRSHGIFILVSIFALAAIFGVSRYSQGTQLLVFIVIANAIVLAIFATRLLPQLRQLIAKTKNH